MPSGGGAWTVEQGVACAVALSILSVPRRRRRRWVGIVAIDGTKMSANAAINSNRDFGQIAREILQEAAETDRREGELYGGERGDELPEHLRTREGRRKGLREAKLRLDRERNETAAPPPSVALTGQTTRREASSAGIDMRSIAAMISLAQDSSLVSSRVRPTVTQRMTASATQTPSAGARHGCPNVCPLSRVAIHRRGSVDAEASP